MPLSPEERRQINYQNSLKSTGPRTTAGRMIASMNAISHGMRSGSLALPNEDQDAIQQRIEEWRAGCVSDNPITRYLFAHALTASLTLDRCEVQQKALV